MYIGREKAGNETITEMVGSACSRYPRDKSGACRSGDGGGDRDGVTGGGERVGYRRTQGGIFK